MRKKDFDMQTAIDDVLKKIKEHEIDLSEAIEANEFNVVNKALSACHGIDIDVKLRKKAEEFGSDVRPSRPTSGMQMVGGRRPGTAM